MNRSVTRRAFLGTIVGAGALAVPFAPAANGATNTLYALDPDWGAGDPACIPDRGETVCGGCYACVRHARNKVFASVAAARRGRAHPRCRCSVVALGSVDPGLFARLFTNGPSVVRRTPGINALLQRHRLVRPPFTPPASGSPRLRAACRSPVRRWSHLPSAARVR